MKDESEAAVDKGGRFGLSIVDSYIRWGWRVRQGSEQVEPCRQRQWIRMILEQCETFSKECFKCEQETKQCQKFKQKQAKSTGKNSTKDMVGSRRKLRNSP